MKLLYQNYKINTENDNENYYTPHKEALAATTIPYCMFKYILSAFTSGDFYCAKTHIVLEQKALPPKLKEVRHILFLFMG